jgi:hypothetical protein
MSENISHFSDKSRLVCKASRTTAEPAANAATS